MADTFTVFLCSTYADLTDERDRVLDAIRRLKLEHDSMEFFGARSNLPIETCLEEVRRSDVLVVIVGHRYGTLVPGRDISFSEAEYREGHRLGKPCLVYIRADDVPVLPRHVERDPDNLRRLEAWKEDLRSRHTVASFSDSQHLAVQIAADLSRTVQALEEARRSTVERPQPRSAAMRELTRILEEAEAKGVPVGSALSLFRRAVAGFLARVGKRSPTIFLSYSHEDSPYVAQIARKLAESSYDVWFDQQEVQPGDSLVSKIERGLDAADFVVFFLSPASTRSKWARQELNVAIARQVSSERSTIIIPVLLDDCEIPALLKDVLYLDLRGTTADAGASRLLAAIHAHQLDRLAPRALGVSNYYNPPQRIPVVGRKLRGTTYHELSTQLMDEEVLMGSTEITSMPW